MRTDRSGSCAAQRVETSHVVAGGVLSLRCGTAGVLHGSDSSAVARYARSHLATGGGDDAQPASRIRRASARTPRTTAGSALAGLVRGWARFLGFGHPASECEEPHPVWRRIKRE